MSNRTIPGEDRKSLGFLAADLCGGPAGAESYSDIMWKDTVLSYDPPAFQIAVRTSDRTHWGVARLSLMAEEEKTYDESERHAKALTRTWHVETYVFDGWEHDRRFFRGAARYRFVGARALVAKAGTSRWFLEVGSEIAAPVAGSVAATKDRWDQICSSIEDACNAFHSIAALFPADTFQSSLKGPRQAVESYRGEAKRLAAIGQSLDKAEAEGALDETAERVYSQLEDIRVNVCEAMKMASEIQLNVGAIFPDHVLVEGRLDLAAMAAVSQEALDRP